MKLNNKGITLVEIIISIALISLVLIFLFSLLVNVNDINKEADVNSTYLINKALILKNIEEDLRDKKKITIRPCRENIYSNYDSYVSELKENQKGYECIELEYGENDVAKLGIYYYKNKKSYVISYIHNTVKATRTLPNFEKYNVAHGKIKKYIEFYNKNNNYCHLNYTGMIYNIISNVASCSNTDSGFYKIQIPIIGEDGKDYTILISYYGTVSVE